VAEVQAKIPELRRRNAMGWDIYITPIDINFHYLLIDDLGGDALDRLRASGFRPALVQQSSADNRQAILKAPRSANRDDEQSIANAVMGGINREFGDPKISGVVHPFRMAGFANKKPGKGSPFTQVLEAFPGQICGRAQKLIEDSRREADEKATERAKDAQNAKKDAEGRAEHDRRKKAVEEGKAGSTHAATVYRGHARRLAGLAKSKGWALDWSRVDYGTAKQMTSDGWEPSDIVAAMLESSPDIDGRHHNPHDYAARTVAKAAAEARAEAQAKRRADHDDDSGPDFRL
jgi:hypothetical protein